MQNPILFMYIDSVVVRNMTDPMRVHMGKIKKKKPFPRSVPLCIVPKIAFSLTTTVALALDYSKFLSWCNEGDVAELETPGTSLVLFFFVALCRRQEQRAVSSLKARIYRKEKNKYHALIPVGSLVRDCLIFLSVIIFWFSFKNG